MTWPELHHTLADLVRAIEPPAGSQLRVDEAALDVPLELTTTVADGELVVLARVPHSRWKAGSLPRTATASLTVERIQPREASDDQ